MTHDPAPPAKAPSTGDTHCAACEPNGTRDYLEIGAIFLVLVAGLFLLRQFNLLPQGLSVTENMGYGLVFLIGLLASVSSCIAVTGGLLVAVAAKYHEARP